MQGIYRFKWLVAGAALLLCGGVANAQEAGFELATPAQLYAQSSQPFMLAANESSVVLKKERNAAAPVAPASEYEPPLISGSNIHQYLGLGTIALAGLSVVTASEGCEGNCVAQERNRTSTHAQLGKATAVMAVATVVSGLISHWDDFKFEDGFTDPDNLHVLLGMTGAVAMAYAVNKSASTGGTSSVSHAALAELGAVAMVVAIKLTW